ncbi:MAG: hypothetical protein WAM94_11910 [Chromatiaceae bacterium]
MTLHDTIGRLRSRLGELLSSLRSRMPIDWGHWARDRQSRDLVATRTAPIGTLSLQEPAAPQVAEQVAAANPAAASM